ncbi:hypothetical protein GCM10025868_35700 [Angustibacter aerolatus]|uniref:biotin carboxylase n=1 Tax=Angustibacter aerolatus TaxID=1162965 RepID=A0ABQ6JJ99_9ACTN|nr:hypothetical protein GCM10025868_35700 [Angustibacter aerolatus]
MREAVSAFGRGECFVEQYLDHPRHVETQCLADTQGNVVVVSTRDCSLQRRHQKLVEEAPAPFLSDEQVAGSTAGSKAILREADYTGAGTCEFLVATDGRISFLEVNTRLQVEHCVSEEVSGLDLVREQLRIARGEALGYDDPGLRGHSIEFRINAEDGGRGFLPAPGTATVFDPPSGPGVRLDSGVVAGDTVAGAFDSMLARLVVTGATRQQALERSRRALDAFVVEGMPTVIPFHRVVVRDPAFAPSDPTTPFTVHTRWIETEFDNQIAPYGGPVGEAAESGERETVVVEVGGKRLEVVLPAGLGVGSGGGGSTARARAPKRSARGASAAVAGGDALTAPMQGTIVKIAVEEGQVVEAGEPRRGARGHEDGAAHHRAQGRHRHRPRRRDRPDRHQRRRPARAQGLTRRRDSPGRRVVGAAVRRQQFRRRSAVPTAGRGARARSAVRRLWCGAWRAASAMEPDIDG